MPHKVKKQGFDVQDFTNANELYLGIKDLQLTGAPFIIVTIVNLTIEEVNNFGRKIDQKVATLQENPSVNGVVYFPIDTNTGYMYKRLIIENKIKHLARWYGHPDNWMGKKLKLIPDPTRKWKGEAVGGIAIEPVK